MTEIKRELLEQLKLDSENYRVVTLLGPRQAGKTTLAKMLFPNYSYVSLEDIAARELAINDPKTFLKRYPSPAIYDEIQRVPELLSAVQVEVDKYPDRKGQYILTGSHQPLLREQVAQTLAGRTSILILYPLSLTELCAHDKKYANVAAAEWIYHGFHPEIYRAKLNPTRTYQAYTQTYVERDVRQLIEVKDQTRFERFLKLLAGRVGQLLNMDSLANDVGVSSKTIAQWISVLESSFIIYRVAPYFENFGKRLVKTPKVYFVDVGLACYLLNIESSNQVERDPLFGSLFENLVVSELMKFRLNRAKSPELYFYRDSHGKEVDVLAKIGRQLLPIEIKTSATFRKELVQSLTFFTKSVLKDAVPAALIYQGQSAPLANTITGWNFIEAAKAIETIPEI